MMHDSPVFDYLLDNGIGDSREQRLITDFVDDNYIARPEFMPGQRVIVSNSRFLLPRWEYATVVRSNVSFSIQPIATQRPICRWNFTVKLERATITKRPIILHLCAEKIKAL